MRVDTSPRPLTAGTARPAPVGVAGVALWLFDALRLLLVLGLLVVLGRLVLPDGTADAARDAYRGAGDGVHQLNGLLERQLHRLS